MDVQKLKVLLQVIEKLPRSLVMCSTLKCSTDDCLGRNFWLVLICSAVAHIAFFFHYVNSAAMGPLPEVFKSFLMQDLGHKRLPLSFLLLSCGVV